MGAGDVSKPQAMAMQPVATTDSVVCILKEVPIGKTTLSVFQDMNGDYQLDMDENQIAKKRNKKKDNQRKKGKTRHVSTLITEKEVIKK